MVVANELKSRYDRVELVLAGGEERTILARKAGLGKHAIEQDLVDAIALEHFKYIADGGQPLLHAVVEDGGLGSSSHDGLEQHQQQVAQCQNDVIFREPSSSGTIRPIHNNPTNSSATQGIVFSSHSSSGSGGNSSGGGTIVPSTTTKQRRMTRLVVAYGRVAIGIATVAAGIWFTDRLRGALVDMLREGLLSSSPADGITRGDDGVGRK